MLKKNIPAALVAGMFFFCAYCRADPLELATDLFEKSEWALCRRECTRALLSGAEPKERFELLSAMSAARSGMDPAKTIPLFESVIATGSDVQVSSIAAYELGRLQWQIDAPEQALASFAFAFHCTTNKQLFLHSACSMFLLMNKHPELKQGKDDLQDQINTSRDQWFGALFTRCAKPDPSNDQPEAPGWFIAFYRNQISPAIGDRCNLEPSCSEYFRQARARHGLKAIPMVADRLIREPGVNSEKKDPLVMPSGQIRYRDPVENHDFWMEQ
jgi:putative component of membrane protein insertase Oxa1/YidC/SpoIIIJ protein YidD